MDFLIIFQSHPLTDRPYPLTARDLIIINKQTCQDGSGKQSTQTRIAAPCTVPHNHASLHKYVAAVNLHKLGLQLLM